VSANISKVTGVMLLVYMNYTLPVVVVCEISAIMIPHKVDILGSCGHCGCTGVGVLEEC